MAVRAGRYKERVLIERFTEGAQNEFGEPTRTWEEIGTFPCSQPMPLSGLEVQRFQQTVAEQMLKIEMRFHPSITFRRKDRATVNGRVLDILNIHEMKRREQLFLYCLEFPE